MKRYFVNMDEYLSSLGLYRKTVARDASSLFRAVSEQLYYSQNYHQRIRQDCADFMRAHQRNFEPFVEGSFEKYLERLEDPKETVGQVEIKALSQLYRRRFLIYRYPGKPANMISDDDFADKVTLCCSINGHYDIIYSRSYPASAALCQSLLYELLYLQVFGCEEAELCRAVDTFRVGGRRYRNSQSACGDVEEEHGQREEPEAGGAAGDVKVGVWCSGHPTEVPPTSRLSLPYKVMKSLDGEAYRNLEFDVWQDTCKEMQKADYMVFAGRQYFLGDKCQVRLEPKGKYYNAFIQEVGAHSAAVTVFIEELGEKHLVPLTDLKPVNPIPAWTTVAVPSRKGDLDLDSRGQRHHRHRFFRKFRGGCGARGVESMMPPPPSYGGSAHPPLPPRPLPPPSPGAVTYDPYHPTARPPRYSASRSSARFLNRHLIGPQLTYYHPGRRYYHDYESYAFKSRRSRRQLEAVAETADLDAAVAFYRLDEATDAGFAPLQGCAVAPSPAVGATPTTVGSSYRAERGPGPLPTAPPQGNATVCSSEDEDEDTSTVEDQVEEYIYSPQDPSYETSDVYATSEPSTNQGEQEVGPVDSPAKPLVVVSSSPSSSSSSSSRAPARTGKLVQSESRPTTSPWLVSELGEPVYTAVAPPPYSYDPNGSDLPRDCRVLQYYFNLGVQWYHQTCWGGQQQQVYPHGPQEGSYPFQHYPPYLSQEPSLHAPPSLFSEGGHAPPQQTEGPGSGPAAPSEGSSSPIAPSFTLLYPEQTLHPPPLLSYEAPPPAHPHHSPYLSWIPSSVHWGALQRGGHAPRVYCPTPNPAHVVSYISAPHPHHHPAAHYIPPTM